MTRPLFKHEPRSEQEVVCLFVAVLPYLKQTFVLDQVQTPFPDCTAMDETGRLVRIEFELYGSNFLDHGHSTEQCDMLVCWADDCRQWPSDFRVWELQQLVAANCPHLIEHIVPVRLSPWTEQSLLDWAQEEGTPEQDQQFIRSIVAFACRERLGPQWLTGPLPVFAVGDRDQYVKINGHGRIGFPFSRLNAGELFRPLVARLNDALGAEHFSESDAETKGKGWILSELFKNEDELDRFLSVWRWLKEERDTEQKN